MRVWWQKHQKCQKTWISIRVVLKASRMCVYSSFHIDRKSWWMRKISTLQPNIWMRLNLTYLKLCWTFRLLLLVPAFPHREKNTFFSMQLHNHMFCYHHMSERRARKRVWGEVYSTQNEWAAEHETTKKNKKTARWFKDSQNQ